MIGFVPGFVYGLCMNDCDPGFMGYVMWLIDSSFHEIVVLIMCYHM